jgi:hypothetical protein
VIIYIFTEVKNIGRNRSSHATFCHVYHIKRLYLWHIWKTTLKWYHRKLSNSIPCSSPSYLFIYFTDMSFILFYHKWQDFILPYDQVKFNCLYVLHLLHPFFIWELRLSPYLGAVNLVCYLPIHSFHFLWRNAF